MARTGWSGKAVSENTTARGRALRTAGSAAIVIAIFWFVLPKVADLSDVWEQVRDMTGLEVGTLFVAAAWNLVTYWILVVQATPGISYPQAMVLTESTTAVSNTVPAGAAVAIGLSYGMLSSWGFSKSRSTVSVLVTGIWNNFAKLGMPILGLALLAVQGAANGPRVAAAAAGLTALAGSCAVFALILRREAVARAAGSGRRPRSTACGPSSGVRRPTGGARPP
jgi:hypothetical protein